MFGAFPPAHRHRVLVSGIGMVTPIGCNSASTWDALCTGVVSGMTPLAETPYFLPSFIAGDRRLSSEDKKCFLYQLVQRFPCRVAAPVLLPPVPHHGYDAAPPPSRAPPAAPSPFLPTEEEEKGRNPSRRREYGSCFPPTSHMPRSYQFCLAAVEEALRDAGLLCEDREEEKGERASTSSSSIGKKLLLPSCTSTDRVGVQIGVGIPSITDVCDVGAALFSYPSGSLGAKVEAKEERVGQESRGAASGRKTTAGGGTHPASHPMLRGSREITIEYKKVHPFFVPKILGSSPAAMISIRYGITGPTGSSVAACATGAYCIGEAALWIQTGLADIVICGSAEACINPVSIAGFSRMRALSTAFNATPSLASRPFDSKRDGFVVGEGAGVLVLESETHARARGWLTPRRKSRRNKATFSSATPRSTSGRSDSQEEVEEERGGGGRRGVYGELRGVGLSSDAHHIAAPHPSGKGVERCIQLALQDGGNVPPEMVGYANAHATGTGGDIIELSALQRALRPSGIQYSSFSSSPRPASPPSSSSGRLHVSSSKGALGHLLGAAGSVEAILALLALHHQYAPPNTNMYDPCWTEEEQAKGELSLVSPPPPPLLSQPSTSGMASPAEFHQDSGAKSDNNNSNNNNNDQSRLHLVNHHNHHHHHSPSGSVQLLHPLDYHRSLRKPPPGGKALHQCSAVVSTSLGFGGLNSCLLFTTYF